MDRRIYIRTIFDKIFKDNIVFMLCKRFVTFYCTIFSHPVSSLKFSGNFPLKNKETDVQFSLQEMDSTKNILG